MTSKPIEAAETNEGESPTEWLNRCVPDGLAKLASIECAERAPCATCGHTRWARDGGEPWRCVYCMVSAAMAAVWSTKGSVGR